MLIGRCPVGGRPRQVSVADGYAYVTAGFGGVRVVNIADPTRPNEVAAWTPGGFMVDVTVVGDRAYVTQHVGPGRLWVLDVSSPTAPRPIGFGNTIGDPEHVTVSGRFAYLGTDRCGLEIIDVGTPESPSIVGYYRTLRSGAGIGTLDNRIYLADMHDGVYIFESPSASGVSEPGAPEADRRFQIAPNPFRRETEILVSSAAVNRKPAPAALLVFDVTGRVVRRLTRPTITRAGTVFHWNGRDDAGADLPAGVYVCALAPGAVVGCGRLLKLK